MVPGMRVLVSEASSSATVSDERGVNMSTITSDAEIDHVIETATPTIAPQKVGVHLFF